MFASGWPGCESAAAPDDVIDALVAALNVGGEAALFERLKGFPASGDPRQLRTRHRRGRGARRSPPRRRPRPADLCTSQIPLGVEGEVVFELAPLALADAVELFTRRARAQRMRRRSVDPEHEVEALCRSLDGLPLAIELAAARTRDAVQSSEIARRLDDRFSILRDPSSPPSGRRRRALRSTMR